MKLLKKGNGNFDYYLKKELNNAVIAKPKPEAKKIGCQETIFGSLKYYKKLEKNNII